MGQRGGGGKKGSIDNMRGIVQRIKKESAS